MDKKRQLRNLRNKLREATFLMAELRCNAMTTQDRKLEQDMKLCWDATSTILHYVIDLLEDDNK